MVVSPRVMANPGAILPRACGRASHREGQDMHTYQGTAHGFHDRSAGEVDEPQTSDAGPRSGPVEQIAEAQRESGQHVAAVEHVVFVECANGGGIGVDVDHALVEGKVPREPAAAVEVLVKLARHLAPG